VTWGSVHGVEIAVGSPAASGTISVKTSSGTEQYEIAPTETNSGVQTLTDPLVITGQEAKYLSASDAKVTFIGTTPNAASQIELVDLSLVSSSPPYGETINTWGAINKIADGFTTAGETISVFGEGFTFPATGTFHVDINPPPPATITVRIGGHQITIASNAGGAADTADDIRDTINTVGSAIASLVTATSATGQVYISANDIGGNFIPISVSSSTGSILRNVTDWGGIGQGGKNGGSTLSGGIDTLSWTTAGGDFGTETSPLLGTQTFEDGDEDLFIDVTAYFSAVRAGDYADRGLIIKLSTIEEAALRSFYTKKFFARSSQYFFLRPCIEVRWDSSTQDDRGNFFASHPMRSDAANKNTIVLKNYVDGTLTAAVEEALAPTGVNVWADSTKNVSLASGKAVTVVTTGTYSSGITLDTDLEEVYIEWVNGTTVLHTETIEVKQRSATETNTTPEYVISITNLKPSYLGKDPSEDTAAEIARFRLYTRLKDWSPTIYSKATKETKTDIIEQAYYKIIRLADEFTVFDYGIDGDEHTKLSYDADGNYFDIDMSLLEVGYSYGIKFMFVIRGEQREQPEVFKFRVE
jgi:hypothetical protein